ncbi:hypothetical protein quinque_002448 [Culex quinquefasciatus]
MVKRGFLAGKSTGMILLDVEKAYDSVWQDAVVYKLFRSNLQPFLVKIVESFLTKRSFTVTDPRIATNESSQTSSARNPNSADELNGIYLTVNRASNDALEEIIDHSGMLSSVDLMQAKMKVVFENLVKMQPNTRCDIIRPGPCSRRTTPSLRIWSSQPT